MRAYFVENEPEEVFGKNTGVVVFDYLPLNWYPPANISRVCQNRLNACARWFVVSSIWTVFDWLDFKPRQGFFVNPLVKFWIEEGHCLNLLAEIMYAKIKLNKPSR